MAAYAHACALAGSPKKWLDDSRFSQACSNANYGQCPSGLVYSDCTTNYLNSCKYISTFGKQQMKSSHRCVQGCVCPENKYLDESDPKNLRCVNSNECSCYDHDTQTVYKPNQISQKGCSNWYENMKENIL